MFINDSQTELELGVLMAEDQVRPWQRFEPKISDDDLDEDDFYDDEEDEDFDDEDVDEDLDEEDYDEDEDYDDEDLDFDEGEDEEL